MDKIIAAGKNIHRHTGSRTVENVLVLQGGGSLGAFACGVFTALVKHKIHVHIAAGTSIGAVNAAIIAGSRSDHPERDLENFWLELAESNYSIIPDSLIWDYDSASGEMELRNLPFGITTVQMERWSSEICRLLQSTRLYSVFPKCSLPDG